MEERRHEKDSTGEVHEVLRARRFELIDGSGRLRAVLDAPTLSPGGPEAPGFRLLDPEGRERAWFGFHEAGIALGFVQGGNDVALFGVDDPGTEAVDPGPRLSLHEADGAVVIEWRVHADGRVVTRALQPRQGDDAPAPDRDREHS